MAGKQEDLRRLMREKMSNASADHQSPFAKVSSTGRITCTVCPGVTIKHWSTHQLSAQHKRNVNAQKSTKAMPPPPPLPAAVQKLDSAKKLPEVPKVAPKSILKNPLKAPSPHSKSPAGEQSREETSKEEEEKEEEGGVPKRLAALKRPASPPKEEPEAKTAKPADDSSALPEGFFDDPKLDAKARNIEYKDPQEVEWEMFQKELREEGSKSEQVAEIDEENDMRERELYEADEMILNWERIRELEIRKDQLKKTEGNDCDVAMEEDDEAEFEEFLNWRQKAVK